MPRRIAVTALNASTVDIINTIRANASMEYQNLVPEITKATEIPKVGEVVLGYPAFANQYLSALVNRIAQVRIKSATFNDAYAAFKKGYLEYGETVEEVFVNIAKAREFSAEKAEQRELKRTLPDVRSAFHTMNWRVQYPVTVQYVDLQRAFTGADGMQDLIAKIINTVYTANEYDEYLLFKYLLIKACSHGKMKSLGFDGSNPRNAAVAFRGTSNSLTFMSREYNASGVLTNTPKSDQYIFMDANYNALYDVDVLSAAFNMDKADFMGHLVLIDSFTTFDNERFDIIRQNSDMIEEVTDLELAQMANVKAILVDAEWFQVYDNHNRMGEREVVSGEYWNYFYNVWKTVSSSPFSNAVAFVDTTSATIEPPAEFTVEVTGRSISEAGTAITLGVQDDTPVLSPTNASFVQTQEAVEAGIAIHRYGAVVFPAAGGSVTLEMNVGGVKYTAGAAITNASEVGSTVTMSKAVARAASRSRSKSSN